MIVFYNGMSDEEVPVAFLEEHVRNWNYLYGPFFPSACEWIVPGTYEAFE